MSGWTDTETAMNLRFARFGASMRGLRREQWLLLALALFLALFVAVLFTETTSVGRGGR